MFPFCRHLVPISSLVQGFCWHSLEIVLGMAAESLQPSLHTSELQDSKWDAGSKTVPLTGSCRLSRITPASNLLLRWACAAGPCCCPGWSPSLYSFPL